MKYCFLLFPILLLYNSVLMDGKPLQDYQQAGKECEYLVKSIDSIPRAYIIYVERNDSIFKLVSLKQDHMFCTRIIAGNYYELQLGSWLDANEPSLIHSDGLYVSGIGVAFSNENIVQDIFYAKNLVGLCISKTN